MKLMLIIILSFFCFSVSSQKIDLKLFSEFNIGTTLGQLRSVPVQLNESERALLFVYSEEKDVDPYVKMFFLPKNTLKMTLYSYEGKKIWKKEMPASLLPGTWFSPVYPMDMDQDGTDEIYLANNTDPDHPFNASAYVLEKLDAKTGETLTQKSWKELGVNNRLSHQFRYYIFGGNVKGKPVLITGTGTYSNMRLQSWDADLNLRWELDIPKDKDGARASHMTPVFDLDGDGNDEFMWGERCIDMGTGDYEFIADRENYWGHSDVIQPVWNRKEKSWYIYTCRETHNFSPRVVLFNNKGNRVWSDLEEGHMDMGWCAMLGEHGEPVSMSIRIGHKVAGPDGFIRSDYDAFVYDTFSGKRMDSSYPVFSTLPVDLNGDGIHELVCAVGEQGDGNFYDNKGNILAKAGQEAHVAIASKFMDLPGEQVLIYLPDGTIQVWADKNAKDNKRAKERYASSFYKMNQKLTASGYNIVNLGGL